MTELEWFQCANPHLMLEHLAKQRVAAKWPLPSWLVFRRNKDASRQNLLFAIACCRRIEGLLVDQRSRYALDIAEKLADGRAGRRERHLAVAAANAAAFDASSPRMGVGGWLAAAQARAAETVAAALTEHNPASVAAARAKEAARAQAKAKVITSAGSTGTPASPPAGESSWNSGVIVAATSAVPADPSAGSVVRSNTSASSVVRLEEVAWANEATIQCEYLRDIFGNPFHPATINRQILLKTEAITMARRIYDERAFTRLPEIAEVLSSVGIDHQGLLAHCRQPGNHVRGCWAIDLLLGM